MQLSSFFRNARERWGLAMLGMALLILLGLGLAALSVARILERHSLPEVVGASIVVVVVLMVVSLLEIGTSALRASIRKRWRSSRPVVTILSWLVFFPVFSLYFLTGDEVKSVPATLEVGVIAVAAALGGLVLNAGLNLCGEKRTEFLLVAQKFVAVVILMTIFLPTLHILDLAGGMDLSSFEPGKADAWFRGALFLVAAVSFYAGVSYFVIALVDLAYAMGGIVNTGSASRQKCISPDRQDQCDGREEPDASASRQA